MNINFSKMHGLGNDFVVINAIEQAINLSTEQYRLISDRHFGIGCDQVLLIEPPRQPDTDFYYRIFNADGSEVEQCGNGARCFVRFVKDNRLTEKDIINVGTNAGEIQLSIESDGQVKVNMGAPAFEPDNLPFDAEQQATVYPLHVGNQTLQISALSIGNPHAVLQVEDVDQAPVTDLGPQIESHPRFPKRVNAGFLQIIDRTHVRLRVYERGAGETLACGTGACAAMVAGRQLGLLDETVQVQLRGGELMVSWSGEQNPVWMIGPATHVFDGRIEL